MIDWSRGNWDGKDFGLHYFENIVAISVG